jgi:hypothetical protein
MAGETDIKVFAEAEGYSPMAATLLKQGVERTLSAALKAIKELEQLVDKIGDDDPIVALGAVRRVANLAGYSNTFGTYAAEVFAAAGQVEGVLQVGIR